MAEVVDTAAEIPQLSMMETTDMVLRSDAWGFKWLYACQNIQSTQILGLAMEYTAMEFKPQYALKSLQTEPVSIPVVQLLTWF